MRVRPDESLPFPIEVDCVPNSPVAGNSLSVTVTLSAAAPSAMTFQLMAVPTTEIFPPAGDTSWPVEIPVADGATAVTFTLATLSTASGSNKLGACPNGVDATNQSNWTASCTVILSQSSPP